MPVMDGAQLVRALRAHPVRRLRAIPVILLTAEKQGELLTEAAAAGADALVSKPITPTALRKAVTNLLRPAPAAHATLSLGAT